MNALTAGQGVVSGWRAITIMEMSSGSTRFRAGRARVAGPSNAAPFGAKRGPLSGHPQARPCRVLLVHGVLEPAAPRILSTPFNHYIDVRHRILTPTTDTLWR
ncbi:hypothetical protein A5734_03655 [Mycolicibacterium fortuitum]|nr:hypothetical protein A5734_03655 [Mycolicibacterium fortuitum]